MKTLTLALGMTLAIGSGMAYAATHDMAQREMAMTMPMSASTNASGHIGIGVIKAVNAKAGKVQISHKPIADLQWPAMTMWFELQIPLPQDLKVGDAVHFELIQAKNNKWVIVKISRA